MIDSGGGIAADLRLNAADTGGNINTAAAAVRRAVAAADKINHIQQPRRCGKAPGKMLPPVAVMQPPDGLARNGGRLAAGQQLRALHRGGGVVSPDGHAPFVHADE